MDLLYEGLVSEVVVGSSLGGKSPILISLDEDSRYLIGLDLAQNHFRGAIVNLHGKIREFVALAVISTIGEEALSMYYEILDRLVKADFEPLLGIGIGAPGLVNIKDGIVVNAVNLSWRDLLLAGLIEERYQLPVYILNDIQAAAIGEYNYGQEHPPDSSLIVINARHGIGAGIVILGRLFHGYGGGAGEIGHVVAVQENGEICRCGNRGCLETLASAEARVKKIKEIHKHTSLSNQVDSPNEINLDLICKAFENNDPIIRQVVLETGWFIGLAIANLVGSLNFQKIVITGDMTCFRTPWMEEIQAVFSKTILSRLVMNTCIEAGKLGENSIILGASAMLANNYSLLFRNQGY